MSIVKINCPKCKYRWEMITDGKMKRSTRQNSYFHGVVLPILSDCTGYTTEEVKDLVKSLFLKDEMMIQTSSGTVKEVSVVRGSSELKTDEFEKFLEKIRQWAAIELHCSIPEPNEEP